MLLERIFLLLKDRLQISGTMTTRVYAPWIMKRVFVCRVTASIYFRIIMRDLEDQNKAVLRRRGVWEILKNDSVEGLTLLTTKPPPLPKLPKEPELTSAQMAAQRLRAELPLDDVKFLKRSLEIAEEFRVSVYSLAIELMTPIPKYPKGANNDPRPQYIDSSYKFKTYDD
jgi:hypothetical protein